MIRSIKKCNVIRSLRFVKSTKKNFAISLKTKEWEAPSVWNKTSDLVAETNSLNLSMGFPDWSPPEFVTQALTERNKTGDHQYTRSFGEPELVNSIAKTYSEPYKREINPMTEVMVGSGANSVLYNIFTSLLNPGDEVITMEPFYDSYLPQIDLVSAKCVGLPLLAPKKGNFTLFINFNTFKIN